MWEIWVQSLDWERSLEKGMATHSSILAWRIPWTIPWVHKESDMIEILWQVQTVISSPIHQDVAWMSMCCVYHSKLQLIRFLKFLTLTPIQTHEDIKYVYFFVILSVPQCSYLLGRFYLIMNEYSPHILFFKLLSTSFIYPVWSQKALH